MGPVGPVKRSWTAAEFAEEFDIDVDLARREHADARANGEYQIADTDRRQ